MERKHKQKNSGFTLIELLVAISVIGVLSSVVLVSLNGARAKSRVARAATDLSQINKGITMYLYDHGAYKETCNGSMGDGPDRGEYGPYVSWPTNPWGSIYTFYYASSATRKFGIQIMNVPQTEALKLDALLDDGVLTTGIMTNLNSADPINILYTSLDQNAKINTMSCGGPVGP